MKKQLFAIFTAFIVLISFSSCKKDEATKNNGAVYDGTEYELSKAYFMYSEPLKAEVPSYPYTLFFVSSAITVDDGGYFSGTGNAMFFKLNSSSDTEITTGTYYYDIFTSAPFTFRPAYFIYDYNFSATKASSEIIITGGVLEISKDNEEYEFTFEGTATGGKEISAYFKGSLSKIVPPVY